MKFRDIFKERIINIPNSLTFLRFLILPFFLYFSIQYFTNPEKYFTIVIIHAILLFTTDFLDGFFARKLNQITMFGKYFDPLVDLLSIFLTLTIIMIYLSFPLWIYILYVLREVGAIYIASVFYFQKDKQALPSLIGKFTTAYGFLLILWYYIDVIYPLLSPYYGSLFFGGLIIISFIESFFRFRKDFLKNS